jgi:hypothetical protein
VCHFNQYLHDECVRDPSHPVANHQCSHHSIQVMVHDNSSTYATTGSYTIGVGHSGPTGTCII